MTETNFVHNITNFAKENNYGLVKICIPESNSFDVDYAKLSENDFINIVRSNDFDEEGTMNICAGDNVFYMYSEDEDFGVYFVYKNDNIYILSDDGYLNDALTSFPDFDILAQPDDCEEYDD